MDEESTAALTLLARMRVACGDNGLRMQDELEEYLRELKRDAERYRWLRKCDSSGEDKVMIRGGDYPRDELLAGAELDAAIDAAMKGANTLS